MEDELEGMTLRIEGSREKKRWRERQAASVVHVRDGEALKQGIQPGSRFKRDFGGTWGYVRWE